MSNPIMQIAQQFQQREVSDVSPRLAELLEAELESQRLQISGESAKEKSKNDARRAELDQLFVELVSNHFLEILECSERPAVFGSSTGYSNASCNIQFWHKSIKIYLTSLYGKLVWDFYMKPIPAIITEFESWSKYLKYEDQDTLKKSALKEWSVRTEVAEGREGLLAVLTEIQQKYEAEMAAFEEVKNKAFEKRAAVLHLSERVQEWNDRIDMFVKQSEATWETLLTEAGEEAWKWPVGKVLSLFEITWQTGSHVESGKAFFAQERGWALSPDTDEDGYFTLLPEVDRIDNDIQCEHPPIQFGKKARKTKATHVMEITRTEVTSLDDLPTELLVTQYLSLHTTELSKGVCTNWCQVNRLSSVEILSEILEPEKRFLSKFPDLCHNGYWNHTSLSLPMPIEEIRLALEAQ